MVIGPVIPRTPSKVSLCPLIEIVGHQRRMGVLRHGPIPPGNRDFFLGLDADLLALAQKSMTQIDRVFQNALDRRIVPQIRCPGRSFLTEFVSVQHSILQRRDNAILVEVQSDFSGRISLGRLLKDPQHHRSCHLIGSQAMFVLSVLAVAIGRAGTILAVLPLAAQHILDLAGAVPQVNLVHGEEEGCHDVLPLGVEVVRDGNIVDAVLGEELLSVVAGLPHIAAQTGQVFGNDGVGLALLELLHHFLKGRAVKVAAGVAIIRKLPHQSDTVLLAVVLYDHALVRNTGRFSALSLFIGETQVGKSQR